MRLSLLKQIQPQGPRHAHGHIEEYNDCKWTRKEEFVLPEGFFFNILESLPSNETSIAISCTKHA